MKQRLLIAENWHVVAESLRAFLIARGFDVSIANDGLECIALVRDFRPDALIVDADLPWGGGDGVSAWLRDELHQPLPVVMMTSDGCDRLSEFDDGHVRYLQRPFRSAELLRAVDSAIERGRGAASSEDGDTAFAAESRLPLKSARP